MNGRIVILTLESAKTTDISRRPFPEMVTAPRTVRPDDPVPPPPAMQEVGGAD